MKNLCTILALSALLSLSSSIASATNYTCIGRSFNGDLSCTYAMNSAYECANNLCILAGNRNCRVLTSRTIVQNQFYCEIEFTVEEPTRQ